MASPEYHRTSKTKVYGWISTRRDCEGPHHQTREIVCAPSRAAAARAAGIKSPRQLWNLCETGNEEEIRVATGAPRKVFWRPLDRRAPFTEAK